MTPPLDRSEPIPDAEFDAWIHVDAGALAGNAKALKDLLTTRAKPPMVIAVVKANAYGHGAVQAALVFATAGIEMFAVTTLAEALELRRGGIEADILVYAPPLAHQCDLFLERNLIATIYEQYHIDAFSLSSAKLGMRARAHLKIDTGMGRFGAPASGALDIARAIDKASESVMLTGIYTHFSQALSKNTKPTEQQFRSFQTIVEAIAAAGIDPGLRHCANSAGILLDERYWLDAVRPGTLLYGQYPAGHLPKKLALTDGWSMHARVQSVRDFPAGAKIGYGAEYTTTRPSRLAVLSVGYADGFTVTPQSALSGSRGVVLLGRSLLGQNVLEVTVRGKQAAVVGRVAMQTCTIDVTDIPGVKPGDIAAIPARRVTASARLPRIYTG